MNMIAAIEAGFRNYARFSGRATRSEYWYWNLFNSVTTLSLLAIDEKLNPGATLGVFSFVTAVIILGLYLPTLAVYVRRLHDGDRSAWWILLNFTVVGIIPLFYWSCLRGTVGPNRFGADTLQPAAPAPAAKQRIRMAAA